MQVHTVPFTESQIFFLTEILILMHFASGGDMKQFLAMAPAEAKLICALIDANCAEQIRILLKEPLKERGFRKRLHAHFANHEARLLREAGHDWLEEILVWEK